MDDRSAIDKRPFLDRLENQGLSLEDRSLKTRRLLPFDLPVFAGHFPGRPLLPGFLEVWMAVEGASLLAGRPLGVQSLDKVRFHQPLLPGDLVDMTVRWDPDRFQASAVLTKDGAKAAVLRMTLVPR